MAVLIAIIHPLSICSLSPALVMAYWIGMYKASDKALSNLHNNPEMLAGFDKVHDRIRKWDLGSLARDGRALLGLQRELEK